MAHTEEILAPENRLDRMADLSRAAEVALRENATGQNLANPGGAPGQTMFEIVTAQRVLVPRDLGAFIQRIKTLAAVAGENYYYSFPVRKKNKQTGQWEDAEPIEGASIQLAQDLAREYGNCSVDTRVIDIGPKWVIYARFTDYERGFSQVRPYLQRKDQSSIGTENKGRQEDAAFQIGVSKAIRNVIVKSLETYSDMMFEQARSGLVNSVKAKLPAYKDRIQQRLKSLGVALDRVEPFVGKKLADWNEFETTRVVMELKSIADGMVTVNELWPAPEKFIDPNAKEVERAGSDIGNDPSGGPTPGPNGGGVSGAANAPGTGGGNAAPGPTDNNSGGGAAPGGAAGASGGGGVPHDPETGEIKEPAAGGDGGHRAPNEQSNANAGGPGAGDAPAGQGAQPPADASEISEKLAMALTELGKLRTFGQVNELDKVCAEQLVEADYNQFAEAKDERLKVLQADADRAAAEAKRKAPKK